MSAREEAERLLEQPKYRIWTLHCPFNKNGFPVVGNFGRVVRPVVIIPLETWNRLCADVPQLQTTEFDVGHYTEDGQ